MGRQFADDSMTPSPLEVHRDKYMDEIAADRPMHENTTPGESAPMYTGRHYADDFSSYGKGVEDMGKTPSRETKDINVHKAERGAES